MSVELRQAELDDIEWLVELRAVVMRADLERLGRFDEVRVRERMRAAYDPAHTWIIVVDGEDAGSISVRPEADARWIEHFYLEPRLQGRGVGTAVLAQFLDEEEPPFRLNVLQQSAARRLYERHGFALSSEDPVDVFLTRAPAPR